MGAFDELFKSHYVLNLSYDEYLGQLFTFVQTTVYNIDVATTNESPRVRELRAKVLKCFICKAVYAPCQSLISHLRLDHSFYPSTRFKLVCAQDCCRRQFSTYSGLKKHLISSHNTYSCQSADAERPEPSQSDFQMFQEPSTSEIAGTSVMQNPASECFGDNGSARRNKEITENICASIIAKLQGSGIANSVVSSVVSDLEELACELHSQVKRQVLSAVSPDNPVREKLEAFDNPFVNFNTESKRLNYFSKKWGVVEPIDKTLGIRFDTRRNKQTGTYDQVPVNDTFVYIPILETIKFMCQNSDICRLLGDTCIKRPDRYQDFCDGSCFKMHPLFSKHQNSLQIQLFYDDFETANPLGSKRGVHKIGALYFVLRNPPPKFNSALMNIHLVMLFHTEDLKKYGFDPILDPLINDIKNLRVVALICLFLLKKSMALYVR